jgi:hypothetical protein
MSSDRLRRITARLLLTGALVVVAGCSDIHPAPDDEGGGVLDSPTHEADSMRQEEERQQEGGGGGARR